MVRWVVGGGSAAPRGPPTCAGIASAEFAGGIRAGPLLEGASCSGTCGRVTIFFGSLCGPIVALVCLRLPEAVVLELDGQNQSSDCERCAGTWDVPALPEDYWPEGQELAEARARSLMIGANAR